MHFQCVKLHQRRPFPSSSLPMLARVYEYENASIERELTIGTHPLPGRRCWGRGSPRSDCASGVVSSSGTLFCLWASDLKPLALTRRLAASVGILDPPSLPFCNNAHIRAFIHIALSLSLVAASMIHWNGPGEYVTLFALHWGNAYVLFSLEFKTRWWIFTNAVSLITSFVSNFTVWTRSSISLKIEITTHLCWYKLQEKIFKSEVWFFNIEVIQTVHNKELLT